jgi:hypothetical protein
VPGSILYRVYESNQFSQAVRFIFEGYHKDIAETVMNNNFVKNTEKDFMVIDCVNSRIVSKVFSQESFKARIGR